MAYFLPRILLCLTFITTTLFTYAQDHYVEGYLIRAPSDTLHGLLLNEDWKISPNAIYFKPTLNATPQKVTATEVKAFHLNLNNEHFVAKQVSYNLYRMEVSSGVSPISQSVQEVVFLQQLVQGGGITLFSLMDTKADQRFYFENQDIFTELVYYKYFRFKDGMRYSHEVNSYIGQLSYFLSACKSLPLQGLSYKEASLTSLFYRYMNCLSIDIVQKSPAKKATLGWGVSGGIMLAPSEGVANLALLSLQVNLPRSQHRAFVLIEAGPVINIPDERHKETILFNMSGGRYFGKKNLQPYGMTGLSFNTSNGFGGLLVGAGVSYKKKIHLEIRNGIFYLIRVTF